MYMQVDFFCLFVHAYSQIIWRFYFQAYVCVLGVNLNILLAIFYSWVCWKAGKRPDILSVTEVTLLIQSSKLFWVYKQYIKRKRRKKKKVKTFLAGNNITAICTCVSLLLFVGWLHVNSAQRRFSDSTYITKLTTHLVVFRQLSQQFTALGILWSGWGRSRCGG